MAELLVAIGVGAKTAAAISTVTAVAAPVFAVGSSIAQYKESKDQAAEFSRQARDERVMSSIKAARVRRDARVKQSRDRVSMLESGAASGTALDVLKQNAAMDELDALTVQYQGEQQARGLDARAKASKRSPLTIFSTAIDSFSQVDPLNVGGQI